LEAPLRVNGVLEDSLLRLARLGFGHLPKTTLGLGTLLRGDLGQHLVLHVRHAVLGHHAENVLHGPLLLGLVEVVKQVGRAVLEVPVRRVVGQRAAEEAAHAMVGRTAAATRLGSAPTLGQLATLLAETSTELGGLGDAGSTGGRGGRRLGHAFTLADAA